jgi:bifunctional UDP-N-acetylglucosamine pyrophosphorylase / glucosamine-1-phosphate N-acetyltransferase
MKIENIAAIILAAGKGTRMKSIKTNKSVVPLGNKQMILHTVDRLNQLSISPVIVVVGFARESVIEVLGNRVIYADQQKRLGTAHALSCGLKNLPENIKTVLVLGGDDSAFYTKEIIENLIKTHKQEKSALSFLTINIGNPKGLGRVVRNIDGNVIGIVEDKDATKEQKLVSEINPGCYVFEVRFLKKYLKKVKKSLVSGEYYLTSLIDIAINNKEKLTAVPGGKIFWRGVNTREELKEAEKLFLNIK